MIRNMSEYGTCADDAQLETLLTTYKSLWLQNPLWLMNASPRIPNPRHDREGAKVAALALIAQPDAPECPPGDLVQFPMSAQAGQGVAA